MDSFIKIPKQLFTISPANARLYAAFLDFKAFNPEGVICPPFKRKADRSYYHYWMKNLLKSKWAIPNGRGIRLVSYQEVWTLLGVEKSWNNQIKKYRYSYHKISLDAIPIDRKEYFAYLTKTVLAKVAGNKKRQIKWRLKNKHVHSNVELTETFLSCRTVAKLFGLNSSSSGHKYRALYFDVINEPTVRNKDYNTHLYKCKKVAL